MEEKPSRQTIIWTEGYLKSDGDFFRRSQGQMQALKESLLIDAPESICSEGIYIHFFIDFYRHFTESMNLETPEYRLTDAIEDSAESSESEDTSDAAFQKRHLKLENKEKILVSADKKQQADSLNKLKRRANSETRTCQDFLRLYRLVTVSTCSFEVNSQFNQSCG